MNGSTPQWVCDFCGSTYGRRDCSEGATWHMGTCDVCEDEDVAVTEPRDFGGLRDDWRDGQNNE